MRLISTFKDYYDSLQDPTDKRHVYVRIQKELEPDDLVSSVLCRYNRGVPSHFSWKHDRRLGQDLADKVAREWNNTIRPEFVPTDDRLDSYAAYTAEYVLFCGKLYRGVRYIEKWKQLHGHRETRLDGSRVSVGEVSKLYWSADAFRVDHEARRGKQKELPDYAVKEVKLFMASAFGVTEAPELMDLHFMTGCPVMTIDWESKQTDRWRKQLTAYLNPCLNDFQFYRVLPAPLAFQELSMFIGGVLSNNDSPEPVDNKYKILAHGFDLKESFRKGPTKVHS